MSDYFRSLRARLLRLNNSCTSASDVSVMRHRVHALFVSEWPEMMRAPVLWICRNKKTDWKEHILNFQKYLGYASWEFSLVLPLLAAILNFIYSQRASALRSLIKAALRVSSWSGWNLRSVDVVGKILRERNWKGLNMAWWFWNTTG